MNELDLQLKRISDLIEKSKKDTANFRKDTANFRKDTANFRKEIDRYREENDRYLKEWRQKSEKEWEKTRQEFRESKKIREEESKKTEEQFKRTDKQLEKTAKKLDKFIGETGNRWGALGENLVEGNLAKKLKERGIQVEGVQTRLRKGPAEFDIVAVNGKETVVVEVKATLDPSDVLKFKKNIKLFKSLWSGHEDKKVYGAMAYLLGSNRQAENLAKKEGFFVISATGDVIIKNKKDFKPRVFH